MKDVTFRTNWSWTIVNDKGEKCHSLEDLTVCGRATVNGENSIEDIHIECVMGDWAECMTGAYRHIDRALPSWLHEKALEAAKLDAGDSSGLLYENIREDAVQEAETIDEDEDADAEDEED